MPPEMSNATGAPNDQPPPLPTDARPIPVPGWEEGLPEDTERVLEAIRGGNWSPEARILKRSEQLVTWSGSLRTDRGEIEVIVKQLPHQGGLSGSLRRLFQRSRSERQCLGAARLAAIGVPTSEPLLLLRGRVGSRLLDWLVLRKLPGTDLINLLDDRRQIPVREQHAIAAGVGELMRLLHDRGLFNRDAKLSNLVRTPEGALGLIDTVGVRQGRAAAEPVYALERMMAPMLFEAVGTDLLPRRALLMRCARGACAEPRKLWRGLERRLRLAGDVTPEIDPRHRAQQGAIRTGRAG